MTYTQLQKSLKQLSDWIPQYMYNNMYKGVYLEEIYEDLSKYMHTYIDDNFPSSLNTELNNSLKQNIDRFLAAKNYNQWKDSKNLLFDSTGAKVPFVDFQKSFKNINSLYNDTWFRTENNFVGNSLNVAKRMNEISKLDNKKYGLKYIATHDNLVRDSHLALDGVVKPIGDSFWIDHTPPIDYNCRCTLVAVRLDSLDPNYVIESDQQIAKSKSFGDKPPQGLNTNVYSSGKFFSDQHPYIRETNRDNDIESVVQKLKRK